MSSVAFSLCVDDSSRNRWEWTACNLVPQVADPKVSHCHCYCLKVRHKNNKTSIGLGPIDGVLEEGTLKTSAPHLPLVYGGFGFLNLRYWSTLYSYLLFPPLGVLNYLLPCKQVHKGRHYSNTSGCTHIQPKPGNLGTGAPGVKHVGLALPMSDFIKINLSYFFLYRFLHCFSRLAIYFLL